MSETVSRILFVAEAVLLLLPLLLWSALFLSLAYPAYPLPQFSWLALAFDAAFVLTLLAMIVACWLIALRLRLGRTALQRVAPAWLRVVTAGALVGLFGVAMLVSLMLAPENVAESSGFALLAPAAGLVPVRLHLGSDRRRAHMAKVAG